MSLGKDYSHLNAEWIRKERQSLIEHLWFNTSHDVVEIGVILGMAVIQVEAALGLNFDDSKAVLSPDKLIQDDEKLNHSVLLETAKSFFGSPKEYDLKSLEMACKMFNARYSDAVIGKVGLSEQKFKNWFLPFFQRFVRKAI